MAGVRQCDRHSCSPSCESHPKRTNEQFACRCNMTRAQVLKIIPHFAEAPGRMNMASGQRNSDSYRLDYHWDVWVLYDNADKDDNAEKVSHGPTLTRRALRVHVEPPRNCTDTWIT